jgi:hypothetical protein
MQEREEGESHFLMPAPFGPRNPKWKGGRSLNDKGYVRVRKGGRNAPHKYEHRRIIEELLESPLCADYVFPEKGKIPQGMTVHHNDHSRTHNCIPNLMLLSVPIHNALSKARWRWIREHYTEWEEWQRREREKDSVPEWVTSDADGQSGEMVE